MQVSSLMVPTPKTCNIFPYILHARNSKRSSVGFLLIVLPLYHIRILLTHMLRQNFLNTCATVCLSGRVFFKPSFLWCIKLDIYSSIEHRIRTNLIWLGMSLFAFLLTTGIDSLVEIRQYVHTLLFQAANRRANRILKFSKYQRIITVKPLFC